jgi:hypothetical protein
MANIAELTFLLAAGAVVLIILARLAAKSQKITREGYYGQFTYLPSCGGDWLDRRRGMCRGATNGMMPSIEGDIWWTPCCGRLGVPP